MARSKSVSKNIQYLRISQDGQLFDLETTLRKLFELAKTVNDTEIEQFGTVSRIQNRTLDFILRGENEPNGELRKGLALHIVNGTKDEQMRTMNNNVPHTSDTGGSLAPPIGQSFVSKEAYIYVCKHDLLFVGNGLRVESICSYLKLLNNKYYDDKNNISLIDITLKPVANLDKLSLIKRYGAKKLHLNASAYQLSLDEEKMKQSDNENNNVITRQFKKIGRVFHDLMRAEPTQEEINAAQDIHVCLALSLDGNTRAAIEAQKFMAEQAELIAELDEFDDGFFIETQRGDKIRPADVRLFKRIKVHKYEKTNTLSQTDIFDGIRQYFQELIDSRLTEL